MAKRTTDLARFWSYVDRESGSCWVWTGGKARSRSAQYGGFWAKGRHHRAHRWIYAELVAPIPAGLEIDHRCRNTLCVRPDHLEVVTGRVNRLRGTSPIGKSFFGLTCRRGHPFSGENLRESVTPKGSLRRECRACERIRGERRKARRRQR